MKQPSRCRRFAASLALAALASFATATAASAQDVRSTTQGFILGAYLNSSSLEVEDGERETGGGGGIFLGYGLSRRVALFLNVDGASIDISNPDIDGDYSLGIVDLGARISFREPQHRLIPYAVLALTGMAASAEVFVSPVLSSDVELRGGGLTLGGGVNYFFTPSLALDVQLLVTGGTFSEIQLGRIEIEIDDLDASAGRFNIGLQWFPSGR